MKFALFSFIVLVALALTTAAPPDLSAVTGAAGQASEAASGLAGSGKGVPGAGGIPGADAAGGLGSQLGGFVNAGREALSSAASQAGGAVQGVQSLFHF